jgi:hypothetical protein
VTNAHAGGHGSLPVFDIRLKYVDELGIPHSALLAFDGYGLSAREHVDTEAMAADEHLRSLSDLGKALKSQSELDREIIGLSDLLRRRSREDQLRFQECEPGGHDEVIGRDFDPQFADAIDEGEVLVNKREDRDFCEIDFLSPCQIEEQV